MSNKERKLYEQRRLKGRGKRVNRSGTVPGRGKGRTRHGARNG